MVRTLRCAVYELVLCACENNGRTPADHLTFGEFSLLVVELRENYKKMLGSFIHDLLH